MATIPERNDGDFPQHMLRWTMLFIVFYFAVIGIAMLGAYLAS